MHDPVLTNDSHPKTTPVGNPPLMARPYWLVPARKLNASGLLALKRCAAAVTAALVAALLVKLLGR